MERSMRETAYTTWPNSISRSTFGRQGLASFQLAMDPDRALARAGWWPARRSQQADILDHRIANQGPTRRRLSGTFTNADTEASTR